MKYSPILALALAIALGTGMGRAQNAISQDGWEGFVVRDADNKFDRCILYNRTIRVLNASPHDMVGITRDGAARIGLLVFFQPGSLTRGEITLRLAFDQRPALPIPAEALSDFHAVVHALDAAALAALRESQTLEASAEGKAVHVNLAAGAAVLDRLETCVKTYGPKP